jgi:hypothetical protein
MKEAARLAFVFVRLQVDTLAALVVALRRTRPGLERSMRREEDL